jgi:hypothetical protein
VPLFGRCRTPADELPGNRIFEQPLLNILWAELKEDHRVYIPLLIVTSGKWSLNQLTGRIKSKSSEATDATRQWIKSLLDLAYDGNILSLNHNWITDMYYTGRPKQPKLRVLVNPVGGKVALIYVRENQSKLYLFDTHRERVVQYTKGRLKLSSRPLNAPWI